MGKLPRNTHFAFRISYFAFEIPLIYLFAVLSPCGMKIFTFISFHVYTFFPHTTGNRQNYWNCWNYFRAISICTARKYIYYSDEIKYSQFIIEMNKKEKEAKRVGWIESDAYSYWILCLWCRNKINVKVAIYIIYLHVECFLIRCQ